MSIVKVNASVRGIMHALKQSHHLSTDDVDQVWGPVVAYQRDTAGHPIQKYMTMLLRNIAGKWLMVRQINNLENGHEWTSRPSMTEISEQSSYHWLLENKFVKATA